EGAADRARPGVHVMQPHPIVTAMGFAKAGAIVLNAPNTRPVGAFRANIDVNCPAVCKCVLRDLEQVRLRSIAQAGAAPFAEGIYGQQSIIFKYASEGNGTQIPCQCRRLYHDAIMTLPHSLQPTVTRPAPRSPRLRQH